MTLAHSKVRSVEPVEKSETKILRRKYKMAIQKKSLITNRAAAKKAIIATNSASADFSATRVATAKLAKAGGVKLAKAGGVKLAKAGGVKLAKGWA
jgi:hypothetical protein